MHRTHAPMSHTLRPMFGVDIADAFSIWGWACSTCVTWGGNRQYSPRLDAMVYVSRRIFVKNLMPGVLVSVGDDGVFRVPPLAP